jgi:hypothetical protein
MPFSAVSMLYVPVLPPDMILQACRLLHAKEGFMAH